jgi:glucokinase
MRSPGSFVLALDVGGTKLAAAAVSPAGEVAHRVQVATPVADGAAVWAAAAGLLRAVLAAAGEDGCLGVGIASAGPIDVGPGTVSPVNIPGWRGFPVVERVRGVIPGVAVRLAGDAVCVAAGEHWLGAGRGCDDMVGMVVSTGVGGGLILGGRPHVGPSGNAGHIGHVSVDLAGPPCACGGTGCVEAIASGPAIAAWAGAQGFTGEPTAAAVAEAARRGDPIARAAFDRAGRAIGSMLAGLATVCDVRVAVVGGGVANAGELLFGPVRAAVERYGGLSYTGGFEVRPAALGADAGLVGAAAFVLGQGAGTAARP